MIRLEAAYRTRPIRFLDYWHFGDWRMKAYGIAYAGDAPQPALVNAARAVTEQRLGTSGAGTCHYHLGFVGIHAGKTGNFVFVDWWADENELHHHVYVSPGDEPARLEYMTPTGLAACAWDLRLIGHERDAWVETVLKRYPRPDGEAYLARVLNTDA